MSQETNQVYVEKKEEKIPNLVVVWGDKIIEGSKEYYPIEISLTAPKTLFNWLKYKFLCFFFPFKIIKWDK